MSVKPDGPFQTVTPQIRIFTAHVPGGSTASLGKKSTRGGVVPPILHAQFLTIASFEFGF
jgi:hypothetical protein